MIGVFDSGIGGLTVLRALAERLPEERFLYLGDHAFAPYGRRPADEIHALTRRGIDRLFRAGCGLVVIACNTAAAVSLRRVQQDWLPTAWPERNVLGVFVPMIESLSGQAWTAPGPTRYAPPRTARSVAIFATKTTVRADSFRRELATRARHLTVMQQACPRLAEAVEEGWDEADLDRGIARYVGALMAKAGSRPVDLAVLGCTHYPLVRHLFAHHLPETTRIVDQAPVCAEGLADYLARHPRFAGGGRVAAAALDAAPAPPAAGGGNVAFLTSGDPDAVTETAARFYGAPVPFRHVDAPLPGDAPATPDGPGPESDALG